MFCWRWKYANEHSGVTNSQFIKSQFKIFLINNNGYLSIKSTHKNFFGTVFGSDPESGIDFPNFVQKCQRAYSINTYKISTYKSLEKAS